MGNVTTDHRVAVNQADTVPRDPRQFSIVDLVALMTLAALVSALAAPFIRALSPGADVRFAPRLDTHERHRGRIACHE